jgi:hypothetical protein
MTASTRLSTFTVHTLGGLLQARRALVLCAVLVGLIGLRAPVSYAASDGHAVTVVEADGLYRVSTTFDVPHPASLAVAVLTDYDHLSEFMSDVKLSRVLERGADYVLVEQEAVARVLFFSRRIHLALRIVETPEVIAFRDTCGKSFVRYEGAWRIVEIGNRVRVTYELVARPTADVPAAIVRRLFSRDVQRTIEQLIQEMDRRALRGSLARAR